MVAGAPNQSLIGRNFAVTALDNPPEGQMVVPQNYAFTSAIQNIINSYNVADLRLSQVRTLYVDNSQNSFPVMVTHGVAQQNTQIPAGGGGFVPTTSNAGYYLQVQPVLLAGQPAVVGNVPITLYNYEIPPSVFGNPIVNTTYNIQAETLPNLIHNAACRINQRVSGGLLNSSAGSTPNYLMDGFLGIALAGGSSATWSQGGQILGALSPFSLKILGGSAGMQNLVVSRRFLYQDIQPFANQLVLLQFKVYNQSGTAFTPSISLYHPFAVNNNFATSNLTLDTTYNLQPCPPNTVTQCAIIFPIPATAASGMQLSINVAPAIPSGSGLSLTDFDMSLAIGGTAGLVSAPPIPRLGTYEDDMYKCRFYLDTTYAPGVAPGTATTVGLVELPMVNGANFGTQCRFSRVMFASPSPTTFAFYDGAGAVSKTSYLTSTTWTNADTTMTYQSMTQNGAIFTASAAQTAPRFCHYVASAEP